jgi:two-component system, OmpR family, alkaline phosphatase synthesis response regulator PhoP
MMTLLKKILIVEDEPDILELLNYTLQKEGFDVTTAKNGKEAIEQYKIAQPDFILMDIMMPEMDGIEACRQIREISGDSAKPYVMFLTARAEEFTEVEAWKVGANDFVQKPVKPRALVSRIKSIETRLINELPQSNSLTIGNLEINKANYTVLMDGEIITLPKKEFDILYFLASNPNVLFSRDNILENVWENDTVVLSRTVDVHIRKLREKIGEKRIKTISGVGYMFVH